MKKLFLTVLFCAFSSSVFCEEAEESNLSVSADNKENPSPLVTGDIFIDAAPGLFCDVMLMSDFIKYPKKDGETIFWYSWYFITAAPVVSVLPFEPVYYRLKN